MKVNYYSTNTEGIIAWISIIKQAPWSILFFFSFQKIHSFIYFLLADQATFIYTSKKIVGKILWGWLKKQEITKFTLFSKLESLFATKHHSLEMNSWNSP
mgnify:CR=1 FL=1